MNNYRTPGPWALYDNGLSICHEKEGHVATAEFPADARLIAAAPDLLAVLKKWEAFARDNYTDNDITWLAETRAAIAKAEGAA